MRTRSRAFILSVTLALVGSISAVGAPAAHADPGPPSIVSSMTATFTEGFARNFTVQATGDPTPSISESGDLPSGVSFTDNGDGTATLGGTPDPGTAGTYPLTITATNGLAPDAGQDFELDVVLPSQPAIISSNAVTIIEGFSIPFTVQATGNPAPSVSESGALPGGVTFTDNSDGTATLGGTPDLGSAGTYPLTITASNGVAPDATQNFTLSVIPPPPNAPVDGGCSSLSLVGVVSPPLVANPTAAVATVKSARQGTVVWGVGFSFQQTASGVGSCSVGGATFNDAKAGAKLAGTASCDPESLAPGLYPLNGKLNLSYAGGAVKTQTYVRIVGFDPVPGPDIITVKGLATKGQSVGATVGGELFFDPVLRAAVDGEGGGPELKGQFYFDNSQIAQSCASGGNAISTVYAGAGLSLLGSPAEGLTFTFRPE